VNEDAIQIIHILVREGDMHFEEVPKLTDNGIYFEIDGLPNLTWLLDLADSLGISPRAIQTESMDRGPGCDTCGYGGGPLCKVTIPRS